MGDRSLANPRTQRLGAHSVAIVALAAACGGKVGHLPKDGGEAGGSGGSSTGASAIALPALRDDWPDLPAEVLDPTECYSIRVLEALPPEVPGLEWSAYWSYDAATGLAEGVQTSPTAETLTNYERWSSEGYLKLILYDGNRVARRDFVPDAMGNTVERMLSYPEPGDSVLTEPETFDTYYRYRHEYDQENHLLSTEQLGDTSSPWRQTYTENEQGECERIERDSGNDGQVDRIETFEHRDGLIVRHDIEILDNEDSLGGSRDEITYTYDAEGRWVSKYTERSGSYWNEGFAIRDDTPEFIEERVFAEDGTSYGEEIDLFDPRVNSEIEWRGERIPVIRYRRAMSPGCALLDSELPRAHRTGCSFQWDDDAMTRWLRR